MSHWDMLSQLVWTLDPPQDYVAKMKQLRTGVNYTQNKHDDSLTEKTWSAARDACLAWEAFERAMQRLNDEVIPF